LSFGSVAAAYERFRPGYPDALVDAVLAYAAGPVRTALEIGAGTGKATRAFAAHGIAVTASDPDPAMLQELRRHVPTNVVTVRAAFEELELGPVHDLVFAAASLHWTEAVGRWERIAGLLRPDGSFASFGGQVHLADPDVAEAVRSARAPYLEEDEVPSPDGTSPESPMLWPGTELLNSDPFTDVQQSVVERRMTMTADEYVGHLTTISAYVVLPDDLRTNALRAIRGVLPEGVAVNADLTLHLARMRRKDGV
jgi:SAM-dependent methyltransferase